MAITTSTDETADDGEGVAWPRWGVPNPPEVVRLLDRRLADRRDLRAEARSIRTELVGDAAPLLVVLADPVAREKTCSSGLALTTGMYDGQRFAGKDSAAEIVLYESGRLVLASERAVTTRSFSNVSPPPPTRPHAGLRKTDHRARQLACPPGRCSVAPLGATPEVGGSPSP